MTGSVGYAPNPRGRRRGFDAIYESPCTQHPPASSSSLETTEDRSLEEYFADVLNGVIVDQAEVGENTVLGAESVTSDTSDLMAVAAAATASVAFGAGQGHGSESELEKQVEEVNLVSKTTIDVQANTSASSR